MLLVVELGDGLIDDRDLPHGEFRSSPRGKMPSSKIFAAGKSWRNSVTTAVMPSMASALLLRQAGLSVPARQHARVIRPDHQHHDFGGKALALAVLQPPEDVLRFVGAVGEVRRFKRGEIRIPHRLAGGGAPIARHANPKIRDGVADEQDINPPLLRLLHQPRMNRLVVLATLWHRHYGGVGPRAGRRLVRSDQKLGRGRRSRVRPRRPPEPERMRTPPEPRP